MDHCKFKTSTDHRLNLSKSMRSVCRIAANFHSQKRNRWFFFRWKIEIYFISWSEIFSLMAYHPEIFSFVAQPRVKIFPLVFTRWNKFRSFSEKKPTKYSVDFMLLTFSGRSFIEIQHSSFPLFPVAYPFRIATNYNITSLVTTRPIPYLHQPSSVSRKSPLELLSVLLE